MNLTKADYEDDVKSKEYLDERPSTQLTKGVAALVFGIGLFFVILMLVVMTPDPDHKINYKLFLVVEGIVTMIIIYGGYTLGKLNKFLRLCERTTEVWQSKKNSKEN